MGRLLSVIHCWCWPCFCLKTCLLCQRKFKTSQIRLEIALIDMLWVWIRDQYSVQGLQLFDYVEQFRYDGLWNDENQEDAIEWEWKMKESKREKTNSFESCILFFSYVFYSIFMLKLTLSHSSCFFFW